MTEEERLREHPRERLAELVQRVDLAEVAAALRIEAHDATAGHRQIVVVRRGPVSVILFVFESNGFMNEHRASGDVIIHVLAGQMEVTLSDEVVLLGRGQFLALAPNTPHSVRAPEPAEMLLTVCKVLTSPDHR